MATSQSRENRPPVRLAAPKNPRLAPVGDRVKPTLLWFGFLGGPVAFGLAGVTALVLASRRCITAVHGSAWLGVSAVHLMSVITISSALIAAAAGLASWQAWRRTRRLASPRSGESLRPTPFWALGGLFLSSVFFVLILLTGGLEIALNAAACS